MKTLTEIKNKVAQRYKWGDWINVLRKFDQGSITYKGLNELIDEAILEYANQCKEAQRESDAMAARIKYTFQDMGHGKSEKYFINKDSILNNPLVTDKID